MVDYSFKDYPPEMVAFSFASVGLGDKGGYNLAISFRTRMSRTPRETEPTFIYTKLTV